MSKNTIAFVALFFALALTSCAARPVPVYVVAPDADSTVHLVCRAYDPAKDPPPAPDAPPGGEGG